MRQTDLFGALTLKRQLDVLAMPKGLRKRILKKMATGVRKNSRKRIRNQRDLDGNRFASRKKRKRGKMLRGFARQLVAYSNENQAVVTIKNPGIGAMAKKHQVGDTATMTKEKMARGRGEPDYDGPATRRQAKALKQEGYRKPRAGGKPRAKATIKWITENLTLGQAGLILRSMRGSEGKDSWVIKLPARSFLGATASETSDLVNTIFDDTRTAIAAAKRA